MANTIEFLFLLILFELDKSSEIIDINDITNEEQDKIIEPNSAKTFSINYKSEKTSFIIDNLEDEESNLQININSIDCNIEIYPKEEIKKQTYLNLYSLIVNSTINEIYIKPLKDIEEGQDKENYENKSCFLTINSYYISNGKLNIENKESNYLYFGPEMNKDLFKIFYEKNNIAKYSFISINFIIQSPLSIDIYCYDDKNQEKNKISKYINDSTFIYLDSDFLMEINNPGDDISLLIHIKNIQENSIIFFQIIEDNNICLLAKNKLNLGFFTSKITNQYYYTEVLQGEEGELMLHNKRYYGELFAKIVNKNDINNIKDINIYPHAYNTELEYNEHKLQLKFNSKNTENCFGGCYLLITYEQNETNSDFPLIGYEFTILSRFWNKTDYKSKIIDLFNNEYYISCFEQGSSPEHYYSIYIPNDAEKIIIQLEGNYFHAFYEVGRKKINTKNPKVNEYKFEINENKNVTIWDIESLNFTEERTISFAFRPKDYFSEIFSYYYFRVLFTKKNEIKYLPMDSNLGNLCLPENYTNSDYFYCYLILKNDYKALNSKFAVSSTNHYEHVKIYITRIYSNNNITTEDAYYNYINNDIRNDTDYYLFKFEFTNNEINNIISSFCDKIENIYPQVYSTQMFYLDNFSKKNYFKLDNYYMNYQFISGEQGIIDSPTAYYVQKVSISPNFKESPILIPINDTIDQYIFSTDYQHIFYFQLIYNMKTKGIEEIKTNVPLTQLLKEIYFPLYYYLKIKSKYNINIDVTIKFKNYRESELDNIYTIKGYIIDEDNINRKINGEYIRLEDPITANYSNAYGIGFLHVNIQNKNNATDNYLLIEINCLNKKYLNSHGNTIIIISSKEYDDEKTEYILPLNKYIIETFDTHNGNQRNKNEYYIFCPEKNKKIFFEISTEYEDIKLTFANGDSYNINNETGFKKYQVIKNDDDDKLHFKVTNNERINTKYMIKYSYNDIYTSNPIFLDIKPLIKYNNNKNDTVDVLFSFKETKVDNSFLEKGIFFLITGSLYKANNLLDELNNIKNVLNEKEPSHKNISSAFYNLYAKDIKTLEFYKYSKK